MARHKKVINNYLSRERKQIEKPINIISGTAQHSA